MSDMKCPVCGKDMVFIESDEGFDVFVCTNSKCQCSGYANESVWKYIERTRKALDKAIWWLHEIVENHRYTPISTAEMALKELEQKE